MEQQRHKDNKDWSVSKTAQVGSGRSNRLNYFILRRSPINRRFGNLSYAELVIFVHSNDILRDHTNSGNGFSFSFVLD